MTKPNKKNHDKDNDKEEYTASLIREKPPRLKGVFK